MVEGYAGYVSIILFMIGFALIIGELFIPGGIVGILVEPIVVTSLLFAGESVVYMAYSILIAMVIAVLGMVVYDEILWEKFTFL